MASLTDTEENALVNALHGLVAYTAPTTPLKLRLMTANGTDATGGTQVTGGTYTAQNYTPATASGGGTSNTNLIRYEGIVGGTVVVGAELWDNAGTPRRLWWSPLAGSITVAANQPLEFAIGAATFTLT